MVVGVGVAVTYTSGTALSALRRVPAGRYFSRAMTSFLLLRHGETVWNRAGRLQGWQDSPLSEAGCAQAEALAARLADERVDLLVASDLGRTRQTAAPIAARLGLDVVAEAGLRERCYGELEGMTWAEIEHAHTRQEKITL